MHGTLLTCHSRKTYRHEGVQVWDSLLRQAHRSGIRGASVFKALAGFGHHHLMHGEPRPFSFRATQSIHVEFLVTDDEAAHMLDWIEQQGVRVFWSKSAAIFGEICESAPPTRPVLLGLFMRESDHHGRTKLFEWLLAEAAHRGTHTGTAFRTERGFGRSRVWHDTRFVDLSVDLAVRVEFLMSRAQASDFLALLRPTHPKLIYYMSEIDAARSSSG